MDRIPLIEQRVIIIEDQHLPEIRLLASELERHKITVEALHNHLLLLVGLATGLDLEIDNCELDTVRGVLRCQPTPLADAQAEAINTTDEMERVMEKTFDKAFEQAAGFGSSATEVEEIRRQRDG